MWNRLKGTQLEDVENTVMLGIKNVFTRKFIGSFRSSHGGEYAQTPLSATKPFSAIAASSNNTLKFVRAKPHRLAQTIDFTPILDVNFY